MADIEKKPTQESLSIGKDGRGEAPERSACAEGGAGRERR
jgi:hypothetical protein